MEKLEYHLPVFDGPLDLLLSLIAKNKLDIYDIPIAELLDQYMEQIALMREENMDVASEFLEMAARLVQIKAASLLPRQEEEEDPRAELTGQLLEYEQCRQAAAALSQRCSFDQLTRRPEPIPADTTYRRVHDPREIAQALVSAWGKGKSLLPPKPESFSAIVSRKIVSVASQVISILRQLWGKKSLPYRRCLLVSMTALSGWPPFWRCWSWLRTTAFGWREMERTAKCGCWIGGRNIEPG